MKVSSSLITALLFLAVALGAFGFIFVQTGIAVSSAIADRANAAAAGQEESAQKNLAAFVADTAAQQSALASYVLTDTSVIAAIQEIEDAAGRNNVSVTIGTISVAPGEWRYHETLAVSFSGTGSFSALSAFIAELESLPQASRLSHLDLQASSGKNWFATIELQFLKEKAAPETSPTAP